MKNTDYYIAVIIISTIAAVATIVMTILTYITLRSNNKLIKKNDVEAKQQQFNDLEAINDKKILKLFESVNYFGTSIRNNGYVKWMESNAERGTSFALSEDLDEMVTNAKSLFYTSIIALPFIDVSAKNEVIIYIKWLEGKEKSEVESYLSSIKNNLDHAILEAGDRKPIQERLGKLAIQLNDFDSKFISKYKGIELAGTESNVE